MRIITEVPTDPNVLNEQVSKLQKIGTTGLIVDVICLFLVFSYIEKYIVYYINKCKNNKNDFSKEKKKPSIWILLSALIINVIYNVLVQRF